MAVRVFVRRVGRPSLRPLDRDEEQGGEARAFLTFSRFCALACFLFDHHSMAHGRLPRVHFRSPSALSTFINDRFLRGDLGASGTIPSEVGLLTSLTEL